MKEKRILAQVTDESEQYVSVGGKWTAAALQSRLGATLRESMKENPPREQSCQEWAHYRFIWRKRQLEGKDV